MITYHYIAEHIEGWIDQHDDPRTVEQLIAEMANQAGADPRVIRMRAYKLARHPEFGT